jgi:hypothetical membrane protein
MLASFAVYGYHKGNNGLMKYFFATGLVLLAVVLWGVFAAPKSSHRLPSPYVFIFRTTMFLISAFFLYLLSYRNWGFGLAMIAVVTQLIEYYRE